MMVGRGGIEHTVYKRCRFIRLDCIWQPARANPDPLNHLSSNGWDEIWLLSGAECASPSRGGSVQDRLFVRNDLGQVL